MRKKSFERKVSGIGIAIFIFVFCSISVFAESSIWVDPPAGRVTVKSTREQMKDIEEILLDFPMHARQISIEAKIVKVSGTVTRKFGSYLEILTGVKVPGGTPGEGSKITYGPETLTQLDQGLGAFEFIFYRLTAQERFEAILNMLLSQGKAEVLANPRVVTLSGEVAGIYVTTEVPYLSSVTYETINDKVVPVENYEYATVGIVLQVLPRIVGEDLVEMSIIPLVGDYEIDPNFGSQHPIFKRQVSPTNVTVKDGESLVIGGLIEKEKTTMTIGLPIISHLPIVGNLFKSQVDKVEEKSLLITIKPHIVTPREIEGRTKKSFHLKYALAPQVAEQVRKVLSPEGSIEINTMEVPPNSIVVRDREDKIALVESLLNSMGTFEVQRRQKQYTLSFTPLGEGKAEVESHLSSKGSVIVQSGKNALLVEDGAYQLSQIDVAIAVLEEYNSSPRERVITLQHVNASDAINRITILLSPEGSARVLSERTLIVEDTRLVIRKVEEELRELDIPQ